MFESFRCEDCIHGEYDEDSDSWGCTLEIYDDKECEENYEDDERT